MISTATMTRYHFINHCEVSTDDGENSVNWHIAVLVEVYTFKSLDLPKMHALRSLTFSNVSVNYDISKL